MLRSWCIAGFVNIVGSYGVFPSLSCCDELSFPFDILFYPIEYSYGFESTWYISWIWISMVTMGYYIHSLEIHLRFTWDSFWHSTRGFPRWHWGNPCIGVDARSCLCFSGRNIGALLRFFVLDWVLWIWTCLMHISYNQLMDTRGDIGVSRWH